MPDAAVPPATILVIDDDAEIRYSLSRVLSARGFQVSEAAAGEQGVALVKAGTPPDLVLLDVRMGGMGGIEALQLIRSANPKQLVILMTAFGTAQTAIEAMKYGAFDYMMKPFDPQKVLALVEAALKTRADLRAVGNYQPTINADDYREGIVGSSAVMQDVFKIIGQVTAADAIRGGKSVRATFLGEGQLPLPELMEILEEQGFRGPLVVDVRDLSDSAEGARHAAEVLDRLLRK